MADRARSSLRLGHGLQERHHTGNRTIAGREAFYQTIIEPSFSTKAISQKPCLVLDVSTASGKDESGRSNLSIVAELMQLVGLRRPLILNGKIQSNHHHPPVCLQARGLALR